MVKSVETVPERSVGALALVCDIALLSCFSNRFLRRCNGRVLAGGMRALTL